MQKLVAGVLVGASLLFALPAVADVETEVSSLAPVVVTATRTERTVDQVTPSVAVITEEMITASGARRIEELLGNETGLEVVQNGSAGALATLSIRGSEAHQVLVLLDGVRLNSPQNGQFDLSNLPVSTKDIERIEIVRGPSSAIYGSNAMGGVIQIFTKKAEAEPRTQVSWSEGRFDSRQINFMTAQKVGDLGVRLSASREYSLGDRENSELDQFKMSGNFSYDLPGDFLVEAMISHLDKEAGLPGSTSYPSPEAHQTDSNTLSALTLRGAAGPTDLTLRGIYDRLDNTYEDPDGWDPDPSRHLTQTYGTEFMTVTSQGRHMLSLGGEFYRDFLDSTAIGRVDQGRWSLFAQEEFAVTDWLAFQLGGRYDAHSDFDDELSPRLGVLVSVTETGRLRASAGKAYSPPTLNDRFWPDQGYAVGNPDLVSETSIEYELGYSDKVASVASFDLAVFRRDTKNLIDWQADESFVYTPQNVSKARTWGGEAGFKLTPVQAAALGMNYTYLHPKDVEADEFLPGKRRHQLGAQLDLKPMRDTQVSISGRYAKYYDEPGRKATSHTVFDLQAKRSFYVDDATEVAVSFGVKNLFDRKYEMNAGYPMPRRQWYAGIDATF